ncbi:E3 ubiquitin-protein ligase, putative [Eimeria brunetti]|uniref:HECT-type E3 ubiquitin transferase n=1 Tax=Eimeria brunetti TaxID=51314 RepID=U6L6L7_9EIME|nr:E3 ubiquitin-protein ligase, putative [Eimeria brunetti]
MGSVVSSPLARQSNEGEERLRHTRTHPIWARHCQHRHQEDLAFTADPSARSRFLFNNRRNCPGCAAAAAMAASGAELPHAAAGGGTGEPESLVRSPAVEALVAEGLLHAGESIEDLKESFLLLDFDAEKSEASAQAAHRLLREFSSNRTTTNNNGSTSSSNSSTSTSNTSSGSNGSSSNGSGSNGSGRNSDDVSTSAPAISGGPSVYGESACCRLGSARRQQRWMQKLLEADTETLQESLKTKKDWESFTGGFPSNFYVLSRVFLLPGAESQWRTPPVDWDPLHLLLQTMYGLCCRLLQRAAVLLHPQQLIFVLVLLVRLLSAGRLEIWHYLTAPQHPAEDALRAGLLLLHILYVANSYRGLRRQLLWDGPMASDSSCPSSITPKVLPALAEIPEAVAAIAVAAAKLDGQEAPQPQQLQQELREINLALFQNETINSSQALLQHEFALWLRLRRGAAAQTVSALLLQQPFTPPPPRRLRNRNGGQNSQPAMPALTEAAAPSNSTAGTAAAAVETAAAAAETAAEAAAPAASAALPEAGPAPATNGCCNASEMPSADGVLPVATAEGPEAAAAAPQEPAPVASPAATAGEANAAENATAAHPVSPGSVPSAEDGTEAARPALPEDPENPGVAAAAGGGGAAAAGSSTGEAPEAATRDAAAERGTSALRNMSVDYEPIDYDEAGVVDEEVSAAATAAANRLGLLPLPLGVWGFPGSPTRLAGATSPGAILSNPSATAAGQVANAPFNHFAVPAATLQTHMFAILAHPFVLTEQAKAEVVRMQAILQQQHQARQAEVESLLHLCRSVNGPLLPFLQLQVRREHVVEDTLQQIELISSTNSTTLRKSLKVVFIGEEGVDQGGVTREFFQLLVDELFNPAYGMFTVDEESSSCWFCTDSVAGLVPFELVGTICGLAIHNAVVMPVRFPLPLFKKLLGWPSHTLQDLATLSPRVARSLQDVLEASAEELKDMELTFTYTVNFLGECKERPLGKHDPNEVVTIENRREYVNAYIQHVLTDAPSPQYEAFKRGFFRTLDSSTLSLLLPQELQLLLAGSQEPISVAMLQKATIYQDGYTSESLAIYRLWNVIEKFTPKQRRQFLMFVTGSDHMPIGGAEALQLVVGRHCSDTHRLPISHTCFNFLLLPDYSSEEKMYKLLLLAIQNCRGFGFSSSTINWINIYSSSSINCSSIYSSSTINCSNIYSSSSINCSSIYSSSITCSSIYSSSSINYSSIYSSSSSSINYSSIYSSSSINFSGIYSSSSINYSGIYSSSSINISSIYSSSSINFSGIYSSSSINFSGIYSSSSINYSGIYSSSSINISSIYSSSSINFSGIYSSSSSSINYSSIYSSSSINISSIYSSSRINISSIYSSSSINISSIYSSNSNLQQHLQQQQQQAARGSPATI